MTTQETKSFEQTFNRLVVAFREPTDAVKMRVYFDALADLPLWAIEDAAVWLQRHGGGFFPSTAKWHERAEVEEIARVREALPAGREEPWHLECPDCEDTGWRRRDCTAVFRCGRPLCEQQPPEHEHGYVAVCPCRERNHTYQRKHAQHERKGKAA